MSKQILKNSMMMIILSLGWFGMVLAAPSDDFVTTWQTSKPNETITIPTTGEGYNYAIDWDNDGRFDQKNITGNASHKYKTVGKHTIRIQGAFPRIYINFGLEKDKIMSVDQWGNIAWTSMDGAFFGASNLVVNAKDSPNLSTVTSMGYMFCNASSFNQDISHWDVSNVTHMYSMFQGASVFNQNIGRWDVSNVTNMSLIFSKANAFNQNISDWNVSNVIIMTGMFADASAFNQDIGQWDVSKVTHMGSMFEGAKSFNQKIGKWNVSNATRTHHMFHGASTFNQDISNWDVSNVTFMDDMFRKASKFSTVNYGAVLANWKKLVEPEVLQGLECDDYEQAVSEC